MRGYNCQSCKLALEIGQTVPWDLTGFYHQIACTACGTLHQIRLLDASPDLLLAQSAPIVHDLESDRTANIITDWVVVTEIEGDTRIRPQSQQLNQRQEITFSSITCHHCGGNGTMCSSDGSWPTDSDTCPSCSQSALVLAYVQDG